MPRIARNQTHVANRSVLVIGTEKFELRSFMLPFSQIYNEFNHLPSGEVEGGMIHMEMLNVKKPTLFAWMNDPTAEKDGKIVIYKGRQEEDTIEFEKGLLVKHDMSWDVNGAFVVDLVILPAKVTWQKVPFAIDEEGSDG